MSLLALFCDVDDFCIVLVHRDPVKLTYIVPPPLGAALFTLVQSSEFLGGHDVRKQQGVSMYANSTISAKPSPNT